MTRGNVSGRRWILLIIFVVGLAIYGTALDNGFYFDDVHQITENSFIRGPGSIPGFFYRIGIYSRDVAGMGHYRPLLLSTFVVNYYLGGLNPIGYHLVNLFFHILSAYILFLIVEQLLSNRTAGVVAGFVVLMHPFNSEVVNYITARSSVMATFFYLLTFYAYTRYRPPDRKVMPRLWGVAATFRLRDSTQAKACGYNFPPFTEALHRKDISNGEMDGGRNWLYLSLAAFVLGILTKEILITMPLILVLYEWVFVSLAERPWGRLAWRILPFLLPPLLYLIIRKIVVGTVGPSVVARDLLTNLLIQAKALAVTWQILLFPVNLSPIHDIPEPQSVWESGVIGSFLLLVVLFGFMVWALRSTRQDLNVAGLALAWFYITLLPTTLIPLNIVIQENRGYIAGMSFAMIMGVLFSYLETWNQRKLRRIIWGVFGVVLIVYGIGVVDRSHVWDNEISLWQDVVHKAPQSHLSHYALGMAYKHLGWLEAAEAELQKSVNLNGGVSNIHSDLGIIYMRMGKEDLAEKEYLEAIHLDPRYDRAHTNLGILYRKRGEIELARRELETALSIYPFSEVALYHLSKVYQQQGQPERALALLTMVLEKNPNLPWIQLLVGRIYQDHGDTAAASEAFNKAVRLDPTIRNKIEEPR